MTDPHFKVHLLAKTEIQPEVFKHLGANGLSWLNGHRCYSEELSIVDNPPSYLPQSEEEAGERLYGQILKPGHFSVLEAFNVTFEVVGFNHGTVMQAFRSRIGVHYSCQSQRYSGIRVLNLVKRYNELDSENMEQVDSGCFPYYEPGYEDTGIFLDDLESVFYARPAGFYTDREGKKFEITEDQRYGSLMCDFQTANTYDYQVNRLGYSEETARDRLSQSLRQSYNVTFNIRSLMAFFDRRLPKNAQWEIRQLATLLFEHLKVVSPEMADWYEKSRFGKNRLSP